MNRSVLLLAVVCLSGAPASAAAPGTVAEVEAAVRRVRNEYRAIQTLIRKKRLRQARLSIGGRQNPNTFRVHYEGGREADYQRDPYASAPLRIRHIAFGNVLPAVGDASADFFFTRAGQLFFVHTRGADLCGVPYELRPTSELRVYLKDGEPFRVIVSNGDRREKHDLPLVKSKAERARGMKAGAALKRRARELSRALEVLGR
jgi:hypothetical protein